jgi:transmembrane sensor
VLSPEKSRIVDFARFAWLGGMAAILMVGFVIWWGVTTQMSPREHYATDSSAQRTMALPDGSVIDINTGSDVAVQFTAKERRIILRRGEAHFQVAHNAERPFIVTAADVSVRAVGTAFDVSLAKEAVNVTVVEGRVSLGRQRAKLDKAAAEPAALLASGERALLLLDEPSAAPKIEKIDARSISALLTWHNPMTSFTDVPLRDVIIRFNRRNPTQLVLEDTDLGERKIGGMIALDQVEAFVRLLEQDGDVVADRASPGRIGLRRAH